METLMLEVRHALRTLAKSRGFTIVAVLTLALGIGASTAIFSIVHAVLFRALPYPNPGELVRVWERAPNGRRMNFSDPNFDDFRSQNETFAGLAEYAYRTASVSGGREPVRVDLAAVSAGFFRILGVEPTRGRDFTPDEQRFGGAPAAIVSHGYWQRYLGGTADLAGARLATERAVYSIVGVMPQDFDFPPGASVWIPRELDPELPSRTAHNWQCVGRLRAGVTISQARANLDVIAARIRKQYAQDVDLDAAAAVPLGDALVGNVRVALLTLLGAVGLLLVVACANVAGLLVARTSSRRRELAVRVALGATRGRLVVQFLSESLALSAAAGLLGVLASVWAVHLLPALLPTNLPRKEGISVDVPVLLFAVAVTAAVAVSLGLFAAWRAAAASPRDALTAGSRTPGGTAGSRRLRRLLVIGEIATTLVILVGAGLLARSFVKLISTSPGFEAQNLMLIQFSAPADRGEGTLTPAIPTLAAAEPPPVVRQIRLLDEVVNRLRGTRGAEAVGLAGAIPVADGDNLAVGTFLTLDGQDSPSNFEDWGRMARDTSRTGRAFYEVASEGYFRTMGIPLVRGRMFADRDDWTTPHVALISESLARQRWPGQDPIGRVINFGNMDGDLKPLTIVGIVGDVRARGLDFPPPPIVYSDYRQRGINSNSSPTILIRSAAPAGQIASTARAVLRDLAPDAPVKFSTFEEELGGWLADRRALLLLVGVFGAAALLLAAIGVYGIVAFSVAHRTQEIGIRMALGAGRRDVLGLILGEGARLALIGVAAGLAASFVLTRLVASLLFGIGATDALTFAAVAMLLTAASLSASYLPAWRATRLDPNVALRDE